MASQYERELRYILSGKPDVVEKMVERLKRSDEPGGARSYRRIRDAPFFVLRSAGSLGVDLVALRGEISFPIEVKTSNEDTVRLSRSAHTKEQAEDYERTCVRAGLVPIYAYRRRDMRKYDPWRIFTLNNDSLDDDPELNPRRGRAGRVYEWIPTADVTDDGNYVLRWGDGQPLHAFVDRLRSTLIRSEPTAGTPRS